MANLIIYKAIAVQQFYIVLECLHASAGNKHLGDVDKRICGRIRVRVRLLAHAVSVSASVTV